MFKARLALFAAVLMAGLGVALLGPARASALSQVGPDSSELAVHGTGRPSDDYGYVVSSSDNAEAAIDTTTLILYFAYNTDDKTVTILDGDLCSDPLQSAPVAGNQRDQPGNGIQGQIATDYTVQDMAQTQTNSVAGRVSNSNTCYSTSLSLTVLKSMLTFDKDAGMYKAQFTASITGTLSQAHNRFTIILSEPLATVSYAAAGLPQNSGVARDYQYPNGSTDYRDYSLPFAPECNVTTPTTATIRLYDLENSGEANQPETMTTYLEEYASDGTYVGRVALTISSAGSVTNGTNTDYVLGSANNSTIRLDALIRPTFKYRFNMEHVYFADVLQFKLPYDSINFNGTTCDASILLGCGAMELLPVGVDPEPNTPMSVRTSIITGDGSTPPPDSFGSIRIDGPAGFTPLDFSPAGKSSGPGYLQLRTTQFTVPTSGKYVVSWQGTISGKTQSCNGFTTPTRTFEVLKRPYVTAAGGDVMAGTKFATGATEPCGPPDNDSNPQAGIASWNRQIGPNFIGGGSQYAALAMGYIQEFSTDQGRFPTQPIALSFANVDPANGSVDPATGKFGGLFGNVAGCVDYWRTKPPVGSMTPAPANINFTNMASGVYYVNANQVTIQPGSITPGTKITLYVEGSAAILGNVTYNGTTWGTEANIQSLQVIVHGTIYIASGVGQLDGLYVAVPNTRYVGAINTFVNPIAGTISTCSSGFNSYDPKKTDEMAAACGNKLTVNGSLVANQIWLLRTFGSVNTLESAETVRFGPEAWLAPTTNSQYDNSYQSVIGLPPIL